MSSSMKPLPMLSADDPEVKIPKRDYPLRNLIAGIALFVFFLLVIPTLFVMGAIGDYPGVRTLVSLADALCAAAFLWAFFLYRSKVQATRQVRLVSTAEVIPAWVSVSGKLKPLYQMHTPISRQNCLYYKVERYVKRLRLEPNLSGEGYKLVLKWVLKSRRESTAPFLLSDPKGSVLIAPHRLQCEKGLLNCEITTDADEPGWFGSRIFGKPAVEYREYYLTADQTAWITGNAEAIEEASVQQAKRLHARLKAMKDDPETLAQFDTNGDGVLDEREWKNVHDEVTRQVNLESPCMMFQRLGMADLPFLLSGEKPDLVTTTERREAFMYILGALAAAVMTVLCYFPFNL